MKTLKEIWDDAEVAHPFLASNTETGQYFLCQVILNGNYFSGLLLEKRDDVFRSGGTAVYPGNRDVWEVV